MNKLPTYIKLKVIDSYGKRRKFYGLVDNPFDLEKIIAEIEEKNDCTLDISKGLRVSIGLGLGENSCQKCNIKGRLITLMSS